MCPQRFVFSHLSPFNCRLLVSHSRTCYRFTAFNLVSIPILWETFLHCPLLRCLADRPQTASTRDWIQSLSRASHPLFDSGPFNLYTEMGYHQASLEEGEHSSHSSELGTPRTTSRTQTSRFLKAIRTRRDLDEMDCPLRNLRTAV